MTISTPPQAARPRHLSRAISGSEFFALGFGTIIGVGWIIVLGDWLRQAGPLVAILAFVAGGLVIILSLGLATAFYCLIILASSMTLPWQSLVRLDLPAAGAFQVGLGSTLLARVVLLAALLGLIATWNAVFFAAARVLFALGRARIIHPSFGTIHPVHGSPATAVLFVGAIGACAVFIGRSAIIPIVNVGATCLAGAFLLTCLGVIRMRRLVRRSNCP